MTFKDGKGREYCPRVTIQFLREYEARTGAHVFDVLLSFALKRMAGQDTDAGVKVEVLELLQRLCPTVDAVFFALYRSSVEKFTEEGFADFCEAMGADECAAMFKQLVGAVEAHGEILATVDKLRSQLTKPAEAKA
jgi:hypothetical protein